MLNFLELYSFSFPPKFSYPLSLRLISTLVSFSTFERANFSYKLRLGNIHENNIVLKRKFTRIPDVEFLIKNYS